ncbi:hypothetical protein [Sphingobacterium zeae]|uniref:hypothetical protein n=1 Tax=Sphingobacterium zeae TaxID=1776859 RepID=UPI003608F035
MENRAISDGLHSNDGIYIDGGKLNIVASSDGIEAEKGRIMVGVGGSTSSPTVSVSTKPSAILSGGSASQIYSVLKNDNNEVLTFKSQVSFSTLLVSNRSFLVGVSYKLVNISLVADANVFNGLYLGGRFINPTGTSSFTLSAMVSNFGGSIGPGGGR